MEKILKKHVEELCKNGDRYSLANIREARDYITHSLPDYKIQKYSDIRNEQHSNIYYCNDYATVYDYIIIAHYDTVRGSPGADDNASSVAVLIELAKMIEDRGSDKDICLLFSSTEEPPNFGGTTMGSYQFLMNLERELSIDLNTRILALDMLGYYTDKMTNVNGISSKGDYIGLAGDLKVLNQYDKVFKRNKFPFIKMSTHFNLSDDLFFHKSGYKCAVMTDTAFYRNNNYHLASDTPDTLDYSMMSKIVGILYEAII